MEKVKCPLMGREIEDVVCFDIHMVVDGGAPEYTAPEEAIRTPGYQGICLNCPNHRDD